MKSRCPPELIHIKELPKNLVDEILIRLPIKDAVRTSILSRKWRYTWTELPQLVFDDRFSNGLTLRTKNKLIMAIYQVLSLHHGPLDVFELSISDLENCPEIDQFVLVVLKAGVKVIALHISKDEPYRVPSSIFAYSQQLEGLHLRSCLFLPPARFNGFSKLVFLALIKVDISSGSLSSLISNCPLLECVYCISLTNCGRIDIIAPNLENFSFMGLCESLCFTNTPKLKTVRLANHCNKNKCVCNKVDDSSQYMLCGRLPVVEELSLDPFYSKHMTANRSTMSFVNDLCHLQSFSLLPMCFGFLDDVSSAMCLVKNSKNLKKLAIRLCTGNASEVELAEVEGFSDVTFDHLREVKLEKVSGSKCELRFIELVLAKSPVLDKFLIRPNSELVGEKGFRFFKELARFQRASPFVQIAY